MASAAHTQGMLPIAYITGQHMMRRSLLGALATDPVVPERPRRPRRPTRAHAILAALAPGRGA
jgi:hypothetical protein